MANAQEEAIMMLLAFVAFGGEAATSGAQHVATSVREERQNAVGIKGIGSFECQLQCR